MKVRLSLPAVFLVLLAGTLACGSAAPTPPPVTETASPEPTPSNTAQPTLAALTLVTQEISEQGSDPPYRVQAEVPELTGSTDGRVLDFNNQARFLTLEKIGEFKGLLPGLPASPLSAVSSYEQTFLLLSPPGTLQSLLFTITTYRDGAAHPVTTVRSLNYDLAAGRVLALGDLFLAGSPYLLRLSELCTAELAGRDIAFDPAGAAPDEANYSRWNITAEGLVIVFDQYQVAPGAAGAQQVLVPWSELEDLVDPSGVLADSLP